MNTKIIGCPICGEPAVYLDHIGQCHRRHVEAEKNRVIAFFKAHDFLKFEAVVEAIKIDSAMSRRVRV